MRCEDFRRALTTGYLTWEDPTLLAVHGHLQGCAGCAAEHRQARRVVGLLAEADPARELDLTAATLPVARPSRWASLRPLGQLAAVLLVGGTTFLAGRLSLPPEPAPEQPAASVSPTEDRPAAPTATPVVVQPVLAEETLRVMSLRDFALQTQVALALQLADHEAGLVGAPDPAGLSREGRRLIYECSRRGERELEQLVGLAVLLLEGRQPDPDGQLSRWLFAELGRLQVGVVRDRPGTDRPSPSEVF